jgi:hypothetical protein
MNEGIGSIDGYAFLSIVVEDKIGLLWVSGGGDYEV